MGTPRTRGIFVATFLSVVLCAAPSLAASGWEIDEGRLPPGLDQKQALALLEETDAASAGLLDEERLAFESRAKRLDEASKGYVEQLRRALDDDPQLAERQRHLDARLRAAQGDGAEGRREELDTLALETQALRAEALARAGIDRADLERKIGEAMRGGIRERGIDVEVVTLTEEGVAVVEHPGAEPDEAPEVRERGVDVVALEAPYPASRQSAEVPGSPNLDARAGTYLADVGLSAAGSGTNRVVLAHLLTVPPDTTRIRVTAEVPKADYSGRITGMLGSAGQALTSRIEVVSGDTLLCSRTVTHADHWVVLYAASEKRGTDEVTLGCSPNWVPPAGSTVVVRFIGEISTHAWGDAINDGQLAASPGSVRVEFTRAPR
jgi:hypothetical protein